MHSGDSLATRTPQSRQNSLSGLRINKILRELCLTLENDFDLSKILSVKNKEQNG